MRSTKKKKLYRYLGIFLKGLMLVLTFWFIYDRISSNQNIDEIIHYFLENSLKLSKIWMPLTVVALVFVNWSLEAIKWRYLIQKIEQI